MTAFFREDLDIGDRVILARLAEEAGLDPAAYAAALDDQGYADRHRQALAESARMDITRETGDPTAHAEVMAMRKAVQARDRSSLEGVTLLATGEPCALCYRVAARHGIAVVRFAVDRDTAAEWGFDYRAGYDADETDRLPLAVTARHLAVERGLIPFARYRDLHRSDFTTHS